MENQPDNSDQLTNLPFNASLDQSINDNVIRLEDGAHSPSHILRLLSRFARPGASGESSNLKTSVDKSSPSKRPRTAEATSRSSIRTHTPSRTDQLKALKQRLEYLKEQRRQQQQREYTGAAFDFAFRHRRDFRHQPLEDFNDALTSISYRSDTDFSGFNSTQYSSVYHEPTPSIDRHSFSRLSTDTRVFGWEPPLPLTASSQSRAPIDDASSLHHDKESVASLHGHEETGQMQTTSITSEQQDRKGKGKEKAIDLLEERSSSGCVGQRSDQQAQEYAEADNRATAADAEDFFDVDFGFDVDYETPEQRESKDRRHSLPSVEQVLDDKLSPADDADISRMQLVQADTRREISDQVAGMGVAGPSTESVQRFTRISPTQRFTSRKIRERAEMARQGTLVPSTSKPAFSKLHSKKLFTSFVKNTKVDSAVYPVLMEATDLFFEQVADDLAAYAEHADRMTITKSDVKLLMYRQGLLTDKKCLEALAHEHLPRELWDLICVSALADNRLFPDDD